MFIKYFRRLKLKKNCYHIVAVSRNNVIGINNGLPWRCKEDLLFFKRTTKNHVVVMGRKTWESLPFKLKDRISIVISSSLELNADNTDYVIRSTEDIIDIYNKFPETRGKKIYIIGGGTIYKNTFDIVKGVLISHMPIVCNVSTKNTMQEVNSGEVIRDNKSFIYYPTDVVISKFPFKTKVLTAKYNDTKMFHTYLYTK